MLFSKTTKLFYPPPPPVKSIPLVVSQMSRLLNQGARSFIRLEFSKFIAFNAPGISRKALDFAMHRLPIHGGKVVKNDVPQNQVACNPELCLKMSLTLQNQLENQTQCYKASRDFLLITEKARKIKYEYNII